MQLTSVYAHKILQIYERSSAARDEQLPLGSRSKTVDETEGRGVAQPVD